MPDLIEAMTKHYKISVLAVLAGISIGVSAEIYPILNPPPTAYECTNQQGISVRYQRSSLEIVGEGNNLRLYVLDEISGRKIPTDDLQDYDCKHIP